MTAALDLGHGEGRMLLGADDGGVQARVARHPAGDLPVVDGGGQRRAIFQIALVARPPVERHQHAVVDVVGVEVLALHEGEIAAGGRAVGRPGVAARHIGRHARMGEGVGQGLAIEAAVGAHIIAPAFGQEIVDFDRCGELGMNVAIHHAQPLQGAADLALLARFEKIHAHAATSGDSAFRRG